MLRAVPDLHGPEALISRVAVQLAHTGASGLAAALGSIVAGTGARSAVLRRTGSGAELLATAGEVVQDASARPRADTVVELAVRGPVELPTTGAQTSGRVSSLRPPATTPAGAGEAEEPVAPLTVPLAVLAVTGARPQAIPLLRDAAAVLGLALAAENRLPPQVAGLLADVEAERSALADALHDGAVQELVAARYIADVAVRGGADPGVRDALQGALVSLRRTLWQLRPRGADGLADALERLSAQLVERGAAPLRVRVDPQADVLPPATSVAAYRLVQAVTAGSRQGAPTEPVTVRLARQDAPGDRSVLALSVDGGAPLAEPARWRRTAAALGGDLLACHGRLRLMLPAPTLPARGLSAPTLSARALPASTVPALVPAPVTSAPAPAPTRLRVGSAPPSSSKAAT